MKIANMIGHSGNEVKNQFVVELDNGERYFQSYDSVIVKVLPGGEILLDNTYWDYSTTTGKYRNLFLGETKKETKRKIESGEYKLTDLN